MYDACVISCEMFKKTKQKQSYLLITPEEEEEEKNDLSTLAAFRYIRF